jgi:Na+-transporting NADH:ubiquinone oxidoreductase subunit NqrB
MNFEFHDVIGVFGVSLIISTYFLSQIGRMTVTKPLYPALNAVGALLILFSLTQAFNAASFVMEGFWLLISLIGLMRAFMLGRKK